MFATLALIGIIFVFMRLEKAQSRVQRLEEDQRRLKEQMDVLHGELTKTQRRLLYLTPESETLSPRTDTAAESKTPDSLHQREPNWHSQVPETMPDEQAVIRDYTEQPSAASTAPAARQSDEAVLDEAVSGEASMAESIDSDTLHSASVVPGASAQQAESVPLSAEDYWRQREDKSTRAPAAATQSRSAADPDEHSPEVVTSVFHTLLAWFSGGNALVRVGVLVLLVGVVLLLRLASQYISIPIELRLAGVAVGGFALTLTGLRLRLKRPGYGVTLQGAGLAIIYLTLFSAFKLYGVLPAELTFGLLAILAAITVGLAVKQDALPLAVLAFGGAFLAPILTSTGSNNLVGLFAYYLLLNAAVAVIAHVRTWKILNLLSAGVTFGTAGLAGWNGYQDGMRWPLEGLLLAHLALYLFIAVRYSQQLVAVQESRPQAQKITLPVVDTGLLFGVPLMGLGLQAALMRDIPYAMAISSAGLSAVYLLLGRYLIRQGSKMRLMSEGVLALGIGFLALVLPLALDAKWTAVGWSVQGAALIWMGKRQQRFWPVVFGLLLQVLSLGIVLALGIWKGFDTLLLNLWVIAVVQMVTALLLRQPFAQWRDSRSFSAEEAKHTAVSAKKRPRWITLGRVVLLVAVALTGFSLQLSWEHVPVGAYDWTYAEWVPVLTLACLCGLGWLLAVRFQWLEWLSVLRVLVPLAIVGFCFAFSARLTTGTAIWLLVLASFLSSIGFLVLRLRHRLELPMRRDQAVWALGTLLWSGVWLNAVIPDWTNASLLLPVAGMLLFHFLPVLPSPLQRETLLRDISLPVLAVLILWVVKINEMESGQTGLIAYVPVLNPLDLMIGTIIGLALISVRVVDRKWAPIVLGSSALAAFWTLSSMVVRTLHEWLGTPLWLDGAWGSDQVQTSLTLVWIVLALILTTVGSRKGIRIIWIAGISLLGLVLLKLVLIDLNSLGAVARVISFIGAGLVMLVIGYVAPYPPAELNEALPQPFPKPEHHPEAQSFSRGDSEEHKS